MKTFIALILAAIILTSGCETNLDPLNHEENFSTEKSIEDKSGSISSLYDVIPLPKKSPVFEDSVFTISKLINGLLGGVINFNRTYISNDEKPVKMLISALFNPLSFFGKRNIRFTIDDSTATIHCAPSMTFLRPLIFTNSFIGLNLRDYDTEDIDFVHFNEDGTIEDAGGLIIVVKPLGIVTVIGANISHFSRYGWVRKSE
ncbi:MAG TPA: hypothetical protein VH917_07020 [Ignavibacteriaceae bacterium]|jgi:hypothetical protein